MKQMYPSLALLAISLVLPEQIQAWANNVSPFTESTQDTKVEPSESRHGLFEMDYLFWKPYQEDLNFGIRSVTTTSADGATVNISNRVKTPDFDLSSGVRLGLGLYTCDAWDIKLSGTYFYSDTKTNAHAAGSAQKDVLFPSYFPLFEGQNGTQLSNTWRLNFGLIDLTLGRDTYLTRKFSIHPFIGIRTAWIRETVKGKFQGFTNIVVNGQSSLIAINPQYELANNVWGIGPRAGLDSHYYFTPNWSFLGGLSGSFVLGNFRNKQTEEVFLTGANPGNEKVYAKDSQDLIRANLDGYLGIGWDQWVNQNKNRIYVALLCETSYWFGINQFMDINSSQVGTVAINTSTVAAKRHGDLALFGGTVHFQIDF